MIKQMKHSPNKQQKFYAYKKGMEAAQSNSPYNANPYDRGNDPVRHLQWSKGHNDMKAYMIKEREREKMEELSRMSDA